MEGISVKGRSLKNGRTELRAELRGAERRGAMGRGGETKGERR
jgi:hypothetical protein